MRNKKKKIQEKKRVKEDRQNKPTRGEKMREVHLKWVDDMLAKRRQAKENEKKLKSVHTDLVGTKSLEYVTKLKNKPTEAELLVSKYLGMANRKFVFQMPIKNDYSFYIIDFFIPKSRLCIEVDGGYHTTDKQQWRDEQRDKFLHEKGYRIMRFTNEEILATTYQSFKRTLRQYEEHEY